MNNPLVSIIIPLYNTEKYISDCLQSVISQTYSNLEIIIINDGSTDNSAEIVTPFCMDKRVVFINRENKGLSATRQQGIDMAHGEYFCTLDADDKIENNFIEKMIKRISETGSDICVCARIDFDENSSKEMYLTNTKSIYELNKNQVEENIHNLTKELWLSDSWNKLYSTEFVRKTKVKFFLNNKYNGTDLSFNNLLILHCPKVCVLNEPLLLHRFVAGSRVHRKNKPLQEGFEVIIERVVSEAEKLGYGDKFYQNYGGYFYSLLNMAFNIIITESKSLSEVLQRGNTFYDRRKSFFDKHYKLMPKFTRPKVKTAYKGIYNIAFYNSSAVYLSLLYAVVCLKRIRSEKDEQK